VRESIRAVTNKDEAGPLAEALALVKAPEAAPVMLELKLFSKAPQVARRWLDEEVGNSVAGLLPVAAGQGPLAEAALDSLREAKRKGHAALLEEQTKQGDPEVAGPVRRLVLDVVEKVHVPFDDSSTPDWLRTAQELTTAGPKAARLPSWADPSNLPPLAVGDHCLNDEQVRAVLSALRRSPLGSPLPLVAALKHHADTQALESFVWGVFSAWLAEGAPAGEKWALTALGHLGSDATVLKLVPLIRSWPGEGQHKRAIHALECLGAINSDSAQKALGTVAQEAKFKTLQKKARELLAFARPPSDTQQ
jgi:hypothetical protein